METVLVTGGTGFVASWCIAALLEAGYAVRTTVRSLDRAQEVRATVARAGVPAEAIAFVVADLMRDEGWDAAMAGCNYVLHVASPVGTATACDWERPAVEGTLRVLGAACRAGVRRVVMTSAAATARPPLGSRRASDETVWADPNDPQFDAYRRSKILSERAAWDFMAAQPGATQLTTILPGAVFGPLLAPTHASSLALLQGLLAGRPPGLPRLGFAIVDVRDLAAMHVHALTAPAAAGERFLAAGEVVWFADIAAILRASLGPRAERVPTRPLPDWLVHVIAWWNPGMRGLAPLLGHRQVVETRKAREILGFAPRPAAETLIAAAESLPI